MVSFIVIILLTDGLLGVLSSIGIWAVVLYIIDLISCYAAYALPAIVTLSISRMKKWPTLCLYAFQALCSVALVVWVVCTEGFSFFPIIPLGTIVYFATSSFIKVASDKETYDYKVEQPENKKVAVKGKGLILISIALAVSCMALALICFNLFQENKELKNIDNSSYGKWLEEAKEHDKKVADEWNKNNPDNPISEETLLPE